VIRLSDRVGKGIRIAPRDALIADSVDPAIRGRVFGFQRAGDHAGGVVGPLVAFALLSWWTVPVREVFLLAAVPGAMAVLVVIFGVREVRRGPGPTVEGDGETEPSALALSQVDTLAGSEAASLPRPFWFTLAVILLFTLGNSTDAFLLLRASQLGVSATLAPVLWAVLHVVKSLASTPGGALSDRIGRRPTLIAGWLLYAAVYAGFAVASDAWHAWALFVAYGVFFGLTEGTERALIADIVPPRRRGSAYGWYHLAVGLGMFPASLLFGVIWDEAGAPTAFVVGAVLSLAAAVGLRVAVPSVRTA
jgi:MFS family permease